MQEREGREAGLSLTYRLIDLDRLAMTVADLPEVLAWARRLGFDGLNVTHPFKQAVVPLLDGAVRGRPRPRRRQHRGDPATDAWSGATPTGRATPGRSRRCCPRRCTTAPCSSAPVAPGSRSATASCARAPSTWPSSTTTWSARRPASSAWPNRFGDDRVSITEDLEDALADAQGVVNATPIGMYGYPGSSVPATLAAPGPVGQRRRLLPARDRAGRPPPARAAAGCSAGAAWPSSRRSAPSSTSPVGPPTRRGWRATSGS